MKYIITLNEDKPLGLLVNGEKINVNYNPFVLEAYDGEAYLVEIALANVAERTYKIITSRVLFGSGRPAPAEEY